jgi:hypothetical protein
MTMTKSERAQMEALHEDLKLTRALKWPDLPCPSPMAAMEIRRRLDAEEGVVAGRWNNKAVLAWFINAHTFEVREGLVDNTCHNSWDRRLEGGWSQGIGRPYASHDEARLALRWEVAKRCAVDMLKAANA